MKVETRYVRSNVSKQLERKPVVNSKQLAPASGPADVINAFGKRPLIDDEEREKLERQALSALAALGYNATPADFGKLISPDLYEREMDIMAEVRAYFHVAYKVSQFLYTTPIRISFAG